MSYLFKYAGSWGGKKLQQIKRNKYLNKQIRWIDIPLQFRALSQKKDTKGHYSLINRWCSMPFGVHHPPIHIYISYPYIYSFQVSMKSAKALPWYGSRHKVPDGRTDGWKDRRKDRRTTPKQYPFAFGGG